MTAELLLHFCVALPFHLPPNHSGILFWIWARYICVFWRMHGWLAFKMTTKRANKIIFDQHLLSNTYLAFHIPLLLYLRIKYPGPVLLKWNLILSWLSLWKLLIQVCGSFLLLLPFWAFFHVYASQRQAVWKTPGAETLLIQLHAKWVSALRKWQWHVIELKHLGGPLVQKCTTTIFCALMCVLPLIQLNVAQYSSP